MNKNDSEQSIKYLKKVCDVLGTQASLAKLLGIPRQYVGRWMSGDYPIGLKYAMKIQYLTNGKIKWYHLRPDLHKYVSRLTKTKETFNINFHEINEE